MMFSSLRQKSASPCFLSIQGWLAWVASIVLSGRREKSSRLNYIPIVHLWICFLYFSHAALPSELHPSAWLSGALAGTQQLLAPLASPRSDASADCIRTWCQTATQRGKHQHRGGRREADGSWNCFRCWCTLTHWFWSHWRQKAFSSHHGVFSWRRLFALPFCGAFVICDMSWPLELQAWTWHVVHAAALGREWALKFFLFSRYASRANCCF